ncbi:MAG: NHL repeat-containing protein [Pseudomonadota bacterium]
MLTRISSSSFQPLKAPGTASHGEPLLKPEGPYAILGWSEGDFASGIAPSRSTMFGARGAALLSDGSLWVSDTGHHRILGWRRTPTTDNAPADIVIGQTDFAKEGRNGKADPTAASVNVPTGICGYRGGLAVADAWNHRVLIWKRVPTASNQPADIVLGQPDAASVHANLGKDSPTAQTMNWPYGVAEIEGRLFVADTGNRRVLIWDDPHETGQPANHVLGQTTFDNRNENAGADIGSIGMRWPHGIAIWNGKLAVSDAGNNRIMLWSSMPQSNGTPCDTVIGQSDLSSCDHNGASYYPSDATMNMPYAIGVHGQRLIVADTANSRMTAFADSGTGAAADRLSCQPDFASKGDNRWGFPERDTVCWPYGLSILGDTIAIADSGNNRILLWELA